MNAVLEFCLDAFEINMAGHRERVRELAVEALHAKIPANSFRYRGALA